MKCLFFLLFLSTIQPGQIKVTAISYITTPDKIKMYWKDDRGNMIGSLDKIKGVEFAMNGGMFTPDYAPVGLYTEGGYTLKQLNRGSSGNWQYKNNGVFWITKDHHAGITPSKQFTEGSFLYATQSGPILLKDSTIQSLNNTSRYIRNGVGVYEDGRVVLMITKEEITIHEFAQLFKNMGCKDALYLDGLVSEAYCPAKNITQCNGRFGVIIGVVK